MLFPDDFQGVQSLADLVSRSIRRHDRTNY